MEKNEMLDTELENISGGATIGGYHFIGEVRPEHSIPGQSYYVVRGIDWCYGQLVEIAPKAPGQTGQILRFNVTIQNGRNAEGKLGVDASQVRLYTKLLADC